MLRTCLLLPVFRHHSAKIILSRNLPRKGFCPQIPKISSPIFTSMQATGIWNGSMKRATTTFPLLSKASPGSVSALTSSAALCLRLSVSSPLICRIPTSSIFPTMFSVSGREEKEWFWLPALPEAANPPP